MNILGLIGGIALFLYGMHVMGGGLEKLGGGKLEKILERLTSNPIKGVLLGAAVTAAIQSSAATTVMVVGFVNSGIMQLSRSIGIIMGANIGTTATAWLLSLSAIEGSGFFINLIKPDNFTPILAIIGAVLIMFTKRSKYKNIGSILIGFAVLMFGMEMMKDAVSGLSESETFADILIMFSNPVLGVIAGAVMTAVMQSSSASVGVLQALSATGSVTFGSALPIIMGQNIGSCVTTLISCIGTSKNAKRAAVIHLYFNVIGTILFLVIFYALNAFIKFKFVNGSVNAFSIAMVHTIFNLANTALMLPFTGLLEKLARMTVKDGEKTDIFSVLDERFFRDPQYALDQSMTLTANMAYIARETLDLSIATINGYNEKTDTMIIENETQLDEYEDALSKYLVRLSARVSGQHQSRRLTMLLHAIGEFERMTDYEVNILYTSRTKSSKGNQFSEKAATEMDIFIKAVGDIMDRTIKVFIDDDMTEAFTVEPLADVIDALSEELKKRHIVRMREGKCSVETGVLFTDYVTSFEKISSHCKSTVSFVIQKNDSSFQMHSDAHEQRRASDNYKKTYEHFKNMYVLPHSNSSAQS